MKRILLFLVAAIGFHIAGQAQQPGVALHSPAYHIADRLDIKYGHDREWHTTWKYVSQKDLADRILFAYDTSARLSRIDRADIRYLTAALAPFLPDSLRHSPVVTPKWRKYVYPTPNAMFQVDQPDFYLQVDPILNVGIGQSKGEAGALFLNQRGVEIQMGIDDRVYIYSNLIETQTRFPNYITRWAQENKAVPGNGFVKSFKSTLFNTENAYDYNNATAWIGFKVSKHFGIEMGHGRHFIGDGYRSLLLSDFSNNYLFLKFTAKIWRLRYESMTAELSGGPFDSGSGGDVLRTKKYASMHFLHFNATKRLSFGVFEAVAYNRSRQLELNYLNPVIFYRTVEGAIGSPDNAMIGATVKYNCFKHIQLYGQILLDEFKFNQIVNPEQTGWWGNKYGTQLGVKYVDIAGIDHLDAQIEWNRVRPYTYSHYDSLNSWTHYRQPLAHPLGANFEEFLGVVRYQPSARWTLTARMVNMTYGEDITTNWGKNPLRSYLIRPNEYGNFIGQGEQSRVWLGGVDVSWQFYHNMYVDLQAVVRRQDGDTDARDMNTTLFSLGLRMNVWQSPIDF